VQNVRLLSRNADLEAEKNELVELSNAMQVELEDMRSSQVAKAALWRLARGASTTV
jgi:hypothetical protein